MLGCGRARSARRSTPTCSRSTKQSAEPRPFMHRDDARLSWLEFGAVGGDQHRLRTAACRWRSSSRCLRCSPPGQQGWSPAAALAVQVPQSAWVRGLAVVEQILGRLGAAAASIARDQLGVAGACAGGTRAASHDAAWPWPAARRPRVAAALAHQRAGRADAALGLVHLQQRLGGAVAGQAPGWPPPTKATSVALTTRLRAAAAHLRGRQQCRRGCSAVEPRSWPAGLASDLAGVTGRTLAVAASSAPSCSSPKTARLTPGSRVSSTDTARSRAFGAVAGRAAGARVVAHQLPVLVLERLRLAPAGPASAATGEPARASLRMAALSGCAACGSLRGSARCAPMASVRSSAWGRNTMRKWSGCGQLKPVPCTISTFSSQQLVGRTAGRPRSGTSSGRGAGTCTARPSA